MAPSGTTVGSGLWQQRVATRQWRTFALLAFLASAMLAELQKAAFACAHAPIRHSCRAARQATESSAASGEELAVDRIMIKILTPEGLQVKTVVSELSLPGLEGRLGILRGHAPLVAPLAFGLLRYKRQGKWVPVVVRGGYASVQDNIATILTSDCERGAAIPAVSDAKQQLETATAALESAKDKFERLQALDDVKLASARLQAAVLTGQEQK
eukprot:TRINITY_DN99345_c0_g1_i1.p1 TRINITY_DN99345_c0_g1~~TRINITY_DN99345_c0_g1_i1.p1  ORF type:complete len:221 (-),score=40.90 TRINITY_DN99345_c0_g1_i1:32-670(-)